MIQYNKSSTQGAIVDIQKKGLGHKWTDACRVGIHKIQDITLHDMVSSQFLTIRLHRFMLELHVKAVEPATNWREHNLEHCDSSANPVERSISRHAVWDGSTTVQYLAL